MPTARCLMASGGALMTAMCTLSTLTRSAPRQPMSYSIAAVMKHSKTLVCVVLLTSSVLWYAFVASLMPIRIDKCAQMSVIQSACMVHLYGVHVA